jgi:hypothetical protein
MKTPFKKLVPFISFLLGAVFAGQAIAQIDVSKWAEDEIHDIAEFTAFLKHRRKSEVNYDVFIVGEVPVANAKIDELYVRSKNDYDFDGYNCRFLFKKQNPSIAVGQFYKISESGTMTTQKDGQKQLFIQLNFREQEKYLESGKIEYRRKLGGATFS